MNYKVIVGEQRIRKWQEELDAISWPVFMLQDKVIHKYWSNQYNCFGGFQFALLDGEEVLGIGNSIPIYWGKTIEELPEGGLDWAVEKGNEDYLNKVIPNALVGIQILVNPVHRNKGLSHKMLDIMKEVAKSNGLDYVFLPLRPTLKSEYPSTAMNDYIEWKNEEGLPFDPWIRVHKKAGGLVVKACNRSMEIRGSVSDWENWTQVKINTAGEQIIDRALAPIMIDLAKDIGTYIEPNVWVVHKI